MNRLAMGSPAHVAQRRHRPTPTPTPTPVPVPAPTPPMILTADAGGRAHNIALSWTDVTGETGYAVERSTDGVTWAQAGTTPTDLTHFYDSGLAENTLYQYRVRALGPAAGAVSTSPSDPVAVRTAAFTTFDSSGFTGVQHPLAGMAPIAVVNHGFWDASGNPDEAGTRAVARAAADAGQMLVFDIEQFPFSLSQATQQQVDQSVAKYAQILHWAHSERPNLKVGFYADLPLLNPSDNLYVLQRLGPMVDFICFDDYMLSSYSLADWANNLQALSDAAQAYRKPLYVFISPVDVGAGYQAIGMTAADVWRFELSEVRQHADGMALWMGSRQPLDATAPWWLATQAFLTAQPKLPAAPAVTLDPRGAWLSWTTTPTDSATAFRVERSTDGGATYVFAGYALAATTGANGWADTALVGGADSWYRVRAVGPFGDSPWSNPVHAVVSRAAPGIIQAENFEAQSGGVTNLGQTIGSLDDGEWVEYRSVDFGGAGANQFGVNVACPPEYAGQRIEVHLDAPTGPLAGTLAVASTGSWTTFVPQSAALSPAAITAGLHDVYLVFRGRLDGTLAEGAGNLDWLGFARNAAPAAPTNLVVNSAGSHVSLTWIANSSDATGYLVERSTDGGATFAPLATMPPGTSDYDDATVPVGAHYFYRVRAVNDYGASAPTNVDDGIGGTADAFGLISPDSLNAGGIPLNWVAYYHLDFGGTGGGAQTLTASLAVPFGLDGDRFQLRLDDVNGPLIGTVTVQATGGWNIYLSQTTLLDTKVTGVHDLYMVFHQNNWYRSMSWFRFGS